MSVRVLVADDHPLYRDGVVRSLLDAGGFDVVAEAATADEAVARAAETRLDLVLLDISMPGGDHAALQRIRQADPGVRVAMLTVSEEGDDVLRALKAGASGYILKGVGGRELARIAADIAGGRTYLAPSLAIRVLNELQAPPRVESHPLDALTRREEDILRLVARGLSNREVAEQLSLQEKTVKHYMTAILGKLALRNRTEAALLARDRWPT